MVDKWAATKHGILRDPQLALEKDHAAYGKLAESDRESMTLSKNSYYLSEQHMEKMFYCRQETEK